MKNNVKFYICEHCGNLVEKVHDAKVPLMCCGQKMKELVPGVVEASHEKHIPVAKVEGNLVKVAVGSVEHPMAEEHSILWVALESDKGLYRKHLEVGAAPEAVFALADESPSQFMLTAISTDFGSRSFKSYIRLRRVVLLCSDIRFAPSGIRCAS